MGYNLRAPFSWTAQGDTKVGGTIVQLLGFHEVAFLRERLV